VARGSAAVFRGLAPSSGGLRLASGGGLGLASGGGLGPTSVPVSTQLGWGGASVMGGGQEQRPGLPSRLRPTLGESGTNARKAGSLRICFRKQNKVHC
jgi:hypothetical protein